MKGPHLSLTNLSVKYSREDHKHMLCGHGPLHWHIKVLCKCSQMPLVHKVPLMPMQITFLHYLTWGMQSQQRIPCGGAQQESLKERTFQQNDDSFKFTLTTAQLQLGGIINSRMADTFTELPALPPFLLAHCSNWTVNNFSLKTKLHRGTNGRTSPHREACETQLGNSVVTNKQQQQQSRQ